MAQGRVEKRRFHSEANSLTLMDLWNTAARRFLAQPASSTPPGATLTSKSPASTPACAATRPSSEPPRLPTPTTVPESSAAPPSWKPSKPSATPSKSSVGPPPTKLPLRNSPKPSARPKLLPLAKTLTDTVKMIAYRAETALVGSELPGIHLIAIRGGREIPLSHCILR